MRKLGLRAVALAIALAASAGLIAPPGVALATSLSCGYENTNAGYGQSACTWGEDYDYWSRSVLTWSFHKHSFRYLDGEVLVTTYGERVRLFYAAPTSFTPTNVSVGHSSGVLPCRHFSVSLTPVTIQGGSYYRVSMGAKAGSQCWVSTVYFDTRVTLFQNSNAKVTGNIETSSDGSPYLSIRVAGTGSISCTYTVTYADGTTKGVSYQQTLSAGFTYGTTYDGVTTIPTDMACTTS
jgi:hypothetical protein